MKILITGGAGFIGSHLSDALLAAGHEITIIDDLSSGTKDFLPKEAEFLKMDIRDEKLTDIFKERHFDIIYHEAAQTMVPASIDNPYLDADINISGMLRVLEAARKTDVQKIIFSSSAAVYGDNPALPLTENLIPAPSSFYGLTKWMTEKYLALYHKIYELSYTVLRYSNVYGPRQGADGEGGVIYIFAKSLAENKPITIFGDGRQTRDFISVHDVVSANLAALHQADGEIPAGNLLHGAAHWAELSSAFDQGWRSRGGAFAFDLDVHIWVGFLESFGPEGHEVVQGIRTDGIEVAGNAADRFVGGDGVVNFDFVGANTEGGDGSKKEGDP